MEQQVSIQKYLANEGVNERINNLLKERSSQFVTSLTAAVNSNEKLMSCDPKTIFTAALTAAAMNLPINNNLGYVYLIPYGNDCQLQFGYKSYIQLAMRSGQFRTLNVEDVREGEIVEHDRLTGEIKFEWLQTGREEAKIVGYVAYMELLNGFRKMLYMTKEQLNAHGVKFSQTYKKGYGLWKDDFNSMAKKTVIKLLLSKFAPMTIDMQRATLADQSIVKDDDTYEYIDNKPVNHEEVSAEKEDARVLKHIEDSKTVADLEQCEEAVSDKTRSAFEHKLVELQEKESK